MEIKKQKINTKVLVKVGILSAISFLLMIAEFPLWFAPGFLKMDLSEIPALLGAFALGPVAGILIEFMKNVLFIAIRGSNSMMVGEIANFMVGSIFVYISGIVYVSCEENRIIIFRTKWIEQLESIDKIRRYLRERYFCIYRNLRRHHFWFEAVE